jgi:7-cyano-7-deazaguanine synthase in queuosine biosynthesis
MAININVGSASYDAGQLKITLDAGGLGTALVKSNFRGLLPLANAASPEAVDFFMLSAAVYGIDRMVVRRANSVDGWSRELGVVFPVMDLIKWQPIAGELSKMLSFLTGDYWTVSFSQSTLQLPEQEPEEAYQVAFAQVNLFSGGLDSLIGAIKFLENNLDQNLLVISHYDSQMKGPLGDQSNLLQLLHARYGDRLVAVPSIKVELDRPGAKETTFRSRSILFIGMAGIVADGLGLDLKVPENGSVSLNYPLSPSRRSACSTRTTHPRVLDAVNLIWGSLGITSNIKNPFEFETKGEMVGSIDNIDDDIDAMILRSNSCGKRRHDMRKSNPDAKHCGVCMPCVYRRAALIAAGLDNENDYGDNITDLNFRTKKGQDIAACIEFLATGLSESEIRKELIVNGLNDVSKLGNYTDLIVRTRNELKALFLTVGSQTVKNRLDD